MLTRFHGRDAFIFSRPYSVVNLQNFVSMVNTFTLSITARNKFPNNIKSFEIPWMAIYSRIVRYISAQTFDCV